MKRWLSVIAFAAPLGLAVAAIAQSTGGGSADSSASTAAKSAGTASTTDTGRWPSSSGATQGAAGPADTSYGSGGNEAGGTTAKHPPGRHSQPQKSDAVSGARAR